MSNATIASPAPARAQPAPPSPAMPDPSGPLDAARAFGVMLGGPILLLGAVTAAAAHSGRGLRRGRLPRPAAAAVLGAAAVYHRWALPRMRRWGAVEGEETMTLPGGWSLVVESDGPTSCRLIARFRSPRGIAATAYAMLLELPHFLMERTMLLTIRRLAEEQRR